MLPGTEQFPYVSCEKQCAVGYFQLDPEIKKFDDYSQYGQSQSE